MILTEYSEEEFREFLKEESWKEGHAAELERGIKAMITAYAEFKVPKEKVLEKLEKEFSLSEEAAEKYLQKYWK